MADLTAQDIVVSILNGDHDEAIVDIGNAIKSRIDRNAVRVNWWVHFGDRYLTPEIATPGLARMFEIQTNIAWEQADPAKSMLQRTALLVAQMVEVDGKSSTEAWEILNAATANDITFGEYARVSPPKETAPDAT